MIDISFIREHPDVVKANNASRNVEVDVEEILVLDKQRRELQKEYDDKRAQQKSLSKNKPTEEDFTTLKALKSELQDIDTQLRVVAENLHALLILLPNINLDDTPIGSSEDDNVELRTVGTKHHEGSGRAHESIGADLGLFDFERGAKVSGNRFWYLKGEAVRLEMALVHYVMQKLVDKGFLPMQPPHLVRREALFGTGFFPAAEFEIYTVNPGEDDLYLIGTSESPLVAYHADEVIDVKQPIRYCAYTPCYRREAGAYGKDTTGILRGHQFNKIEMVSFTQPEVSLAEHQFLLSIEEEILEELGLAYRVIAQCSADISPQAGQCFDIEAWMPGQQTYREVTSCSNTTDYQSRRLNIRYKTSDGLAFVHTLNGTAIATGRIIIALLENFVQDDGSVILPKVLHGYMGTDRISHER